ncbi:unnamed protein product [Rhizopus stolonifer]
MDTQFLKLLDLTVDLFFDTSTPSPQNQWESLKHTLQDIAKRYIQPRRYHQYTRVRARVEYSDPKRDNPGHATRWHEQGERNNKYFYRVIQSRQAQQTIQSLRSSTTNEIVTSASDIIQEAQAFYRKLYSPDPIDDAAVTNLLHNIPPDILLTTDQANRLMGKPNLATVDSLLSYAPIDKSPGLDGIPFEVYK